MNFLWKHYSLLISNLKCGSSILYSIIGNLNTCFIVKDVFIKGFLIIDCEGNYRNNLSLLRIVPTRIYKYINKYDHILRNIYKLYNVIVTALCRVFVSVYNKNRYK